jgi:hypothetical protein
MESEGLDEIHAGRAAAADRLVTPGWYHPALGILLGGYIIALVLGSPNVRLVAVAVFLVGLFGLMRAYKRLTGVWISGFDAGRASRWAYAMGAAVAIAIGLAFLGHAVFDAAWPVIVAAALAAASVIVLGNRFDNALREQLRSP